VAGIDLQRPRGLVDDHGTSRGRTFTGPGAGPSRMFPLSPNYIWSPPQKNRRGLPLLSPDIYDAEA